MSLGIVVVNFGSHSLLARNLAAIDLADVDATAIVVDSHSTTEERRVVTGLAREHGWELVAPDTNVGFGIGMNLGAARAESLGCTHLLLLNPDVEISAEQIGALLHHAAAHTTPGTPLLLSPRLDRPDGSVWFAGGQLDEEVGRTTSRPDPDQVGPHRWLTGACVLVDLATWTRLGGFDERYFLYWEDVDLSQRCLAAGGDVRVVHDVVVVHDVGGTQGQGKSPVYAFHMCRNRLLFASLRRDPATRRRWLRHAPEYARRIALQDGRRAALRRPALPLAVVRGTCAGTLIVARSLWRDRRSGAHGPRAVSR